MYMLWLGIRQTCTAQSFFAHNLSSVVYSGALAFYYYLMIVREWTESDILNAEPYFHLIALICGLGTAVASLFLKLFNPLAFNCWIMPYPQGCVESWKGQTTCIRGDNATLYQWAFYYVPLWIVIATTVFFMSFIYRRIKVQERRMKSYSFSSNANENTSKLLERSKNQALLYVGAYFVSWSFPTIFQVFYLINDKGNFSLLLLTAIFVPTQGFLKCACLHERNIS